MTVIRSVLGVVAIWAHLIGGAHGQSVVISSVYEAALEVYDGLTATRIARACLPSGPITVPVTLTATAPKLSFASLDLAETTSLSFLGLRIREKAGAGGDSFSRYGTAFGCNPTSTGRHDLMLEFENPGELDMPGKLEIELTFPIVQIGLQGNVFIDVDANGSKELDVVLWNPTSPGTVRREVPWKVPARSRGKVLYAADAAAFHPWYYDFTVHVRFFPNRGVLARSYGTSCAPLLQLARVSAERNTATLRGSNFTPGLPGVIALGVQAQDVPLGSGTCRLLLVPGLVLPLGSTTASGNLEITLTASANVLGLRAQMFAWSPVTSAIESSTGLLLNVIP